ncbi:MAG: protein tyrosine phosphatase [Legionella sp.]|jgi:hypothetical protein
MNYILVLLLLLLNFSVFAIDYKVRLGDTKVVIRSTSSPHQNRRQQHTTYVHLHKNEQTALNAAKAVIKKQGGTLITLVHPGGRTIVFHLHRKRYEFDPNRIFTDTGIKNTLTQYRSYSPQAHREVKKLAVSIKHLLPKGKIIAVHNNSHYSLKDYMPGHQFAKNAKKLHKNPKKTYRNFYLVTKFSDFKRLKNSGFNGVLQKRSVKDDGSLSVLLADSTYINVEAGYDQLYEQIRMLQRA